MFTQSPAFLQDAGFFCFCFRAREMIAAFGVARARDPEGAWAGQVETMRDYRAVAGFKTLR